MKILIEANSEEEADELIALLNGAAAAQGKKKPTLAIIEDSNLEGPIRRGRDEPSVGYAFKTLIIPLNKILGITLSGTLSGASLALELRPSEYAILNTLHEKHLSSKKPPF